MDLCLVPSGDHFNVGLGFVGTGPGDATSDGRAQAPPFPSSLLGKRMNVDGRIRYRVGGDGRAELVSATLDDPALASRHERTWRRQVHEWLRKRRFKPEVIDGQPTATMMEFPVQYRLIPMDAADEPRRRVAQQLADTEACRAAGNPAERREVAMDSRFVLLPEAGIR